MSNVFFTFLSIHNCEDEAATLYGRRKRALSHFYAISSQAWVEILRMATVLEIASTAFCVLMCLSAMWIALSYGIKMCQNVMRPQQTVILIFNVQERRRTIFPGVPEAIRRHAQENDEPINLWMDQENFGEFVFLRHNFPPCWSNKIFFKSFLQRNFTRSMKPPDTSVSPASF